jgi:hypothetical protein
MTVALLTAPLFALSTAHWSSTPAQAASSSCSRWSSWPSLPDGHVVGLQLHREPAARRARARVRQRRRDQHGPGDALVPRSTARPRARAPVRVAVLGLVAAVGTRGRLGLDSSVRTARPVAGLRAGAGHGT